jgi:hypothetical protein
MNLEPVNEPWMRDPATLQALLPPGHGLTEQQQEAMVENLANLLQRAYKNGGATGMQLAYLAMGVDFDADAFRGQS